jgi:hypothetical protein
MQETRLSDFEREIAVLAKLRDELRLKAHLARAEIRTELDQLEHKWALADEQYKRTKAHAKQDIVTVQRELAKLLHDLNQGYHSIKRSFETH